MVARLTSSIDSFSRFLGLSVGQFYLFCAFVTLWEVVARYVFHAPTSWAFEVVMVLCATAWMLSVGYVTSHQRHIGITVFYIMASETTRWWLDLLAMLVGVISTLSPGDRHPVACTRLDRHRRALRQRLQLAPADAAEDRAVPGRPPLSDPAPGQSPPPFHPRHSGHAWW